MICSASEVENEILDPLFIITFVVDESVIFSNEVQKFPINCLFSGDRICIGIPNNAGQDRAAAEAFGRQTRTKQDKGEDLGSRWGGATTTHHWEEEANRSDKR